MRYYTPRGLLALDPRALGMVVSEGQPSTPAIETRSSVAVITIRGPLAHHKEYWGDSYEGIMERFTAALETQPRAIVLKVDSPGGTVSGAFETARALRRAARAAGVKLLAYVDGAAASAAYALSTAADEIHATPSSDIGSIGVIETFFDVTAADERHGVAVTLVASGARKTDGDPHVPLTEAALAASQRRVDQLAETFFELVREHRGVDVAALRALQGDRVLGPEAVRLGLADALSSFEDVLALASGNTPARAAGATNEESMEEDEEKARKALQAIADDEEADEQARKRARRALKAMDEDEDDDDATAESEEEDEEAKKAKKAKASAKTSNVTASTAGELASAVQDLTSRLAAVEREREEGERARLLASRPDLSPSLVKVLQKKPLTEVQAIVSAIEAPPRANPAAASSVRPTLGAGQGDGQASRLPPAEKAALDARMGLTRTTAGVVQQGNKLILGAQVPVTNGAPGQQSTPPAPTRSGEKGA
ncbi:MAG: S49 family peptidase [Sandaracinaceae bacterium]